MIRDVLRHLAQNSQSPTETRIGGQAFPARLSDSSVLELIRTEVLPHEDTAFVNEFLVEIIHMICHAINKEIPLVRQWLKEPKEEENVDESDLQGKLTTWDPQGLIPLLFDRLEKSIPRQAFLYNTVIDLLHHVAVPDPGQAFVKLRCKRLMKEVYLTRMEVPRAYLGETRLFYPNYVLNQDNLHELGRRAPEVEEAVKFHFSMTLGKIEDISLQLVKAQLTF